MGRRCTGALVSVVERRSCYIVLGKVPSKQAEHVATATIVLLVPHKGHTQTITADNGKEFAHHATISQTLDAAIYFAHPYHAWERGLNENTNWLSPRYVPKGMVLDTLSVFERGKCWLHHSPLSNGRLTTVKMHDPHSILSRQRYR